VRVHQTDAVVDQYPTSIRATGSVWRGGVHERVCEKGVCVYVCVYMCIVCGVCDRYVGWEVRVGLGAGVDAGVGAEVKVVPEMEGLLVSRMGLYVTRRVVVGESEVLPRAVKGGFDGHGLCKGVNGALEILGREACCAHVMCLYGRHVRRYFGRSIRVRIER